MNRNFIWGLLVVAGFPFLNACKDDEPPKPASVTFDLTEEEVTESDGTTKSFHPKIWESYSGSTGATGREIKVKVKLDKPLDETAVLTYSVGGTATKNSAAVNGDFEITGSTLTIEKGATETFITFTLFEDLSFEVDPETFETIVLTLESVVTGPAIIGDQKTYTLKVNEDDTLVSVEWITTKADLDLFLWFENDIFNASVNAGAQPEAAYIPAGFPNGTYGISYTYYEGTEDNLTFTANIQNLGGTVNASGSESSFTGNYSLANINRYDSAAHPNYKGDPIIVQTMKKAGLNYTNVTQITKPSSGSRIGYSENFRSLLNDRSRLRIGPFTNPF